MSSQESWQTGASSYGGAGWGEDPPDQQSVEGCFAASCNRSETDAATTMPSMICRRLDQLALKTDAARVRRF
jgi:hypothetical protein